MPDREWQRIETLFHAALPLGAAERAAFLRQECAGNGRIQTEVESLIDAFVNSNGFIDQPAFDLGMEVLQANQTETMSGKTVGSYRVLQCLGKGGMGEVYLAEDTRLERKVGLKFLSPEFVGDNWAKRQLIKEAQAVAILDHPNICPVYGVEEHEGQSFIVMQYVKGETLADIIRDRALPITQVLPLAQQMIGALAEAHSHGIIHRDIKPKNIMVTDGGQVKVLDFGLAKTIQPKHSVESVADTGSELTPGMIPGTIAYMSPEQLRAEKLDYRSDIFSVGIVLHEMVSGKNPFAHNNNAEIISSILTLTPQPLVQLGAGFPRGLDHVVQRCLKQNPDERYQSASELRLDLDNIERGIAVPPRRLPLLNVRTGSLLAAALLLMAVLVFVNPFRTRYVHTVAVLPITNESGDPRFDYLEDGFAESLIIKLSRLSQLRISALNSVLPYRARVIDSRSVGRALGADTLLVEKIVQDNQSTLLRVDLIETAGGSEIWGEQYDVNANTISDLREEISGKIAVALNVPLGVNEKTLLSSRETQSEPAFLEYLRGRHYWNNRNKENIQKAIEKFKAAIDLDPAFAKAHAGLADCYVLMNTPAYGDMSTEDAMGLAKSEAGKALEIDNTLADAHTSLGLVLLKYDWNWQEAENQFKEAIRLDSDYAPAHYWYSNLLTVTLRQQEAARESALALRLDASSASNRANFCRQSYYAREYEKAAACANEILKDEPDSVSAKYLLGYAYVRLGLNDQAIAVFNRLPDKNRALKLVALGYAYCQASNPECLKLFADVKEMQAHEPNLPSSEMAVLYLGRNDRKNAIDWLEKAYQQRSASIIYLSVEPGYDTLRSDPKFVELTRRLNLPFPPNSATSPG